MTNIPNAYQRLDAASVMPQTITLATGEQFLAATRLMPAGTIRPGMSFEHDISGYMTTGASVGLGVTLNTYLGGSLLLTTGALALTANLSAPTGFRLKGYFDVNADGTINAQGEGVLSIGGANVPVMFINTGMITGVVFTADNVFRSSVVGAGTLVGTSKIVVQMNRLRSTFSV